MNKTENVDYVLILPGNTFSADFVLCFSNTLVYLMEDLRCTFKYFFGYAPVISSIRNHLLTPFDDTPELFGGKLTCKKVIFIDSDVLWTVKDLKKLIDSPYDVINGIYVNTGGSHSSVRPIDKPTLELCEDAKLRTEIYEAKHCGLGFTAVTFEALKSLEYPWFSTINDTIVINSVEYINAIGEDAYFFHKLRDKGYRIYVDPAIRVGHQKLRTLQLD